ncbi:MAG TPA: SpoIIE family protein phosphatase, partial [Actinomycetota bacterium]|nr:SpoIIE family protein phosphatase [Actinomycetota bacterium]
MSSEEALEGFYGALVDDDAQELYDRAPCGYLSTTPEGTIIKVNQTFLTWTGYTQSELLGRRTFAELLTAGGRIYHETHYAPMLQMQGIAREIALDIVCADGRRLPALVNSVLERKDGAAAVIRTAIFDATERRKYERELLQARRRAEESERKARELVQTLQKTLIPPAAPDIPGLDLSAVYRASGNGDEVGGDFYDVFEIGAGDWMVSVGDVRGKGVEAAVVTALARHTIRAAAVRHPRPSQVLSVLNEVIFRHDTDRFCTAVLVRLRKEGRGWRASIACGGHPLPLLARAGAGPVPFGAPGLLLGSFEDPAFEDCETKLEPGDILVLYTDGVTEARGPESFFGEERLEGWVGRPAQ